MGGGWGRERERDSIHLFVLEVIMETFQVTKDNSKH